MITASFINRKELLMKNFISVLIIISLFFIFSVPSFAKSTLSYFDTVVINSQNENSREAVFNDVIDSAKQDKLEKRLFVTYPIEVFSPQTEITDIKTIINGATQTFFQK